MLRILRLGCIFASFLFALSAAQTPNLENELKSVLERNIKAANEEDIVGYLLTVHLESPVYGVTQDVLEPQFATYDLAFELLELRLLTVDGEYAFARGRQRTTKLAGPDFTDGVTDSVYVFRREGGAWKLWQQSPLETLPTR